MAPTVQELINILQKIAPEALAEDWDNVGLLVGKPSQPIHKVLLALDPSPTLVNDAVTNECDLILTHHPLIFRPLKSLRTDQPTGQFIALALQHNIAVIGCHTNLDATIGGVSDVLAEGLGITNTSPIVGNNSDCTTEMSCGLGRIGTYNTALHPQDFIDRLLQTCRPPWLLEAGRRPQQVKTVAVCGGSCGDFAERAFAQGADVFVTAEIKHSVARWAEDAGFWIIDGGHFATENPAMVALQQQLQQHLAAANIPITITTAQQQAPLRIIKESVETTLTLNCTPHA